MSNKNPYAAKSKNPYKADNVNMQETHDVVTKGLEESQTVTEITPHLDHHSDVPEGNVEGVMTWVGDDKDRAKAALESEEEAEKPRKTLVAKLKELIDG